MAISKGSLQWLLSPYECRRNRRMKVVKLIIVLLQLIGVRCKTSNCFYNDFNSTYLRLTFRTSNFIIPVGFYDPNGVQKGYCDFYQICDGITYDIASKIVVLDLPDVQLWDVHGIWSSRQGSKTFTTNVSTTGDMLSSTEITMNGLELEYNSRPYVNITCSSCREPYSNSVEFYANHRSGETITYHRDSKTCFMYTYKCTPGLCSCSAGGSKFTKVFRLHSISPKTFSCVMRFKNAKQTFKTVSNLYYDGNNSFKYLGSNTIIEVDKTGNGNDDGNQPEQEQNEGVEMWIGIVIIIIGTTMFFIVCLGCILWRVRLKKKNTGNEECKRSESEHLLHSSGTYPTDDQMRRYLVTTYLLDKYLSPVLREYVKNGMEILYKFWKSKVKIHNQSYLNHVITYEPKNSRLNYSAINRNSGKNLRPKNYDVRNVVDFSKLFLPTSLARYDDFGQTCDIESLVELIITVEEFDILVKKRAVELKDIVMKMKVFKDKFHNDDDFRKIMQTMEECLTFFTSEVGDASSTNRKGILSPTIVTKPDVTMFAKWVKYGTSAISNKCLANFRNSLDQQKSPLQLKNKDSVVMTIEEEEQPLVEFKSMEQEMDDLEERLTFLMTVDEARITYQSLFERYQDFRKEFLSFNYEIIMSWNKERRLDFFEDLQSRIRCLMQESKSLAEQHKGGIANEMLLEIMNLVSDLEKETELLLRILASIKSMTLIAVEIKDFCNGIDVSFHTTATCSKKLSELQIRRRNNESITETLFALKKDMPNSVIEKVTNVWNSISKSLQTQITRIEKVLEYQRMKSVHLTKVVNVRTGEVSFMEEPSTNLQLEGKRPDIVNLKGTERLTVEEMNFFHLCKVIIKDAYKAVQTYFDQIFLPDNLHEMLQKHAEKLNILKRKHIIQQRQWNLIFPKEGSPESNAFDLTLMILLVKHVSSVVFPDTYPSAEDLSPGADLMRIQHYRNVIAHLATGSLDNTSFNEIFKELISAVCRLGGRTIENEIKDKGEVINAENIQFNVNEMKEMYWDLERNFKEQLRAYEQLVHEYTNETNEDVSSKLVELFKGVDLQFNRGELPKEEKLEDESFIYTHTAEKLLQSIKDGKVRHVAVTGESGVGKSFTVRHIASRLTQHKFETFFITNSDMMVRNELLSKFNAKRPSNKRLYIFDDFCGVNMTGMSDVTSLLPAVDFVKMLTGNEVVVCIICPLHFYDNEAFRSIRNRNDFTEFNMSSDDLRLTEREKTEFAKEFLNLDNEMIPEAFFSCHNVPLLCKLYQRDRHLNINDLFGNYHSVYEKGINAMLKRGDHYGYCALALCVLFNNELETQLFTEKDKRISKSINAVCEKKNIPLDVISPGNILQELSVIPILQNVEGVYKTIHDSIFDFLCVYFGKELIDCILENASSDFLMERICLVSNDKHETNTSLIYVQDKHHDRYRERITRDWLNGKLEQVFGSVNMKYPKFRDTFLSYIKKLDLIKQHNLKHSTDNKTNKSAIFYIRLLKDNDFIYWSTSADDKENSKSERLYLSCKKGDTITVKSLLETECLIKFPAYEYLFTASQWGHADIVNILLEKGTDPNEIIENGTSSLYAACRGGHLEIVKTLLSFNANVNINKNSHLSPLYIACKKGHLDIVRALLQKNANPIVSTKDGMTPLHIACAKGECGIAALLLNSKLLETSFKGLPVAQPTDCIDTEEELGTLGINNKTNNGITPLFLACLHNHHNITKLLIKHGADPNIGKKEGDHEITPLFAAVQERHVKIVEELLVGKTEINKSSYNITPLYIACEKNFCNIVELLLKKNANVENTNIGFAPIHIACAKGNTEIVRLLLKYNCKDNIELCSKYGQSPLYIACFYRRLDTTKLLLENGAQSKSCYNTSKSLVDEGNEKKDALDLISPLCISCFRGYEDIVETLLIAEASCNLNPPSDQWSVSPLYLSTVGNHVNVVKILIIYGVDLGLRFGGSGETCLHKACELGNKNLVDIFIREGMDISLLTEGEATPLYVAAENGHNDIVQMLINCGADTNHRTKLGLTPLFIAYENNYIEVVKTLIENMNDINSVSIQKSEGEKIDGMEAFHYPTPLHIACFMNCPEVVDLLLSKGARTDFVLFNSGASPLFVACQRGNVEIVEKILQHNKLEINRMKSELERTFDAKEKEGLEIKLEINEMIVNQIIDTGETPLHIACETGCCEIVRMLLEYGADVNSYPTDLGMLPLHIACQKGFSEIGKVLLSHCAAVNEQTESGATPIFIASQYGKIDMVKLLLREEANPELNNNSGISPLQVAEENGFSQISSILKDMVQG